MTAILVQISSVFFILSNPFVYCFIGNFFPIPFQIAGNLNTKVVNLAESHKSFRFFCQYCYVESDRRQFFRSCFSSSPRGRRKSNSFLHFQVELKIYNGFIAFYCC